MSLSRSSGRKIKSLFLTSRTVHWLCIGVMIVGACSEVARAQLPKAPPPASQSTQGQAIQVPEDPLGRTTPRGTVLGFLTAAYGHNYTVGCTISGYAPAR